MSASVRRPSELARRELPALVVCHGQLRATWILTLKCHGMSGPTEVGVHPRERYRDFSRNEPCHGTLVSGSSSAIYGRARIPYRPTPSLLDLSPKPGIDPIPEGETNDPPYPKGEITIDAANGVVSLRGTLENDALADDIVERVKVIDGVVRVEDLLQRR